jgi:tRNA A-37 threonylcarbamoyl transferase component Bud32
MAAADLGRIDAQRDELVRALPAYEIGDVLGRGAFAVVYAGRHRRLEREVAIKRLTPELLRDEEVQQRFAAEARLLAMLDHPHIVRVHDYVEHADLGALVMERLHGGTLADRMALGPLPPAMACALVVAALHGLEHAHQQGVLHRDIKPANLLFGSGELVKVADFGVARMLGAQGARLTATAGTLGTPAYMAPEQVRRALGPLSPATDVWAAGAVLYELLAGAPPFAAGGDIGDVLVQRISEDPPALRERAPAVPAVVASVVMRALARDPGDRYATAGEFATALEAAVGLGYGGQALAASGIALHRTPARPPAGETLAGPVEVDPPSPVTPVARPRSRTRVLALALAAVAGAVVIALAAGGGSDRAGGAPAGVPGPPPGWPATMALGGQLDPVDGLAGVARRVGAQGFGFDTFDRGPTNEADWSADPRRSPGAFATAAHARGLFPFALYYEIRSIGRAGRDDAQTPQLRRTFSDPKLMLEYWRNVRSFLRSLGRTGIVTAVDVEPGAWSAIEQPLIFDDETKDSVAVRVAGTGLPELHGLPDNFNGFAFGWKAMRNRYAPKVLLGWGIDDYGAGTDLSVDLIPRKAAAAVARRAALFFTDNGARFDFASIRIGSGEEGFDSSRESVYSSAERENVLAFTREFVRISGVPLVLANIPLGNTVMRTIDDKRYHWRDSWVQWLIGDDDFTNLRRLRDAGVIGVQFGVAAGDQETCPCDAARDGVTNAGRRGRIATSADDDGGYLAARLAALRHAGGLRLR